MDLLFERVRVCRYNINIKNSSVSLCIPAQSVTMCNVHPQSFLQPLLPCSASTSLTHYPIVPELSQTFSWLHFDPATQEILRCSYPLAGFPDPTLSIKAAVRCVSPCGGTPGHLGPWSSLPSPKF